MSGTDDDKNSPAKTGNFTLDTLPYFGEFKKGEYDPLKKKVNDLSVTVNGLSIGVDSAKLAFGGVAGGATLMKADFTGFKVDEKGVSFMGNQLHTWPWARDKKTRLEERAIKSGDSLEQLRRQSELSTARARSKPESTARRLKAEEDRKAFENAYLKARDIQRKLDQIKKDAAKKKEDAEKNLKSAKDRLHETAQTLAKVRRAARELGHELA
ncbi:hypothetical protein [Streptomyces luteireticuli]|uniref:Uncharacterized protein n=1 Tax=Streptomyces luteireticuli TaxID=173858 RepID=A0ABN0Z2K4_9ACTN